MNAAGIREYRQVADRVEEPRYRLSQAQFSAFWEDGYLGPLTCDAPGVWELPDLAHRARLINRWDGQPVPAASGWSEIDARHINVYDPHAVAPEIRRICAHPSIVNPIAQILGSPRIELFQSRFRVKFPQKQDPVPWHQDVGDKNGGCYDDGSPIPTITVWLSIDGATEAGGPIRVVPGTHRELFGDWQQGFHSKLEETGAIVDLDTSKSIALEAEPSQFYLFHSWTVHTSTPNTSDSHRSAMVMRFVAPEDALHPEFTYVDLLAG